MKKYFIHDGQNQKGPFDVEQLKSEQINKSTPIWYEGLPNWTTAGEVQELQALIEMEPAPPPFKVAAPPPLPHAEETKVVSVPALDGNKKKKKLLVPLIIAGVIIVGGIIGWLIYQNKSQADDLNNVQEQIDAQQQQKQDEDEQESLEQQQAQEEKDRVNKELTEKYMGYRNNWSSYIGTSSNQYTYSELGGISDLAVIVTNQTDKMVDEVQVRVDYMKANGSKYKSETVSVTNIGPKSSKSVFAPESDRGVSVQMEIESITAKSFHFCYPFGMGSNNNIDPYFCK